MLVKTRPHFLLLCWLATFWVAGKAVGQGMGSFPMSIFENSPLTNGQAYNGFLTDSTQSIFKRDALVIDEQVVTGGMIGGTIPLVADLKSFNASIVISPIRRLIVKGGYNSNTLAYPESLKLIGTSGSDALKNTSYYGSVGYKAHVFFPLTFNVSLVQNQIENAALFKEKFTQVNAGASAQLGKLRIGILILNANKAVIKGAFNPTEADSLALEMYGSNGRYEYQIEPLYIFPVSYTFNASSIDAELEVAPQVSYGVGKAYNSFPISLSIFSKVGLGGSVSYRYVSESSLRSYLPKTGWATSIYYRKGSVSIGYALSKASFFRTIFNHQVFLTYQIRRR